MRSNLRPPLLHRQVYPANSIDFRVPCCRHTPCLRRYCLVEKSKAEQFFKWRQNILANQNKDDRYIVDEASAEKRLMLCLFPEIAKEVEG